MIAGFSGPSLFPSALPRARALRAGCRRPVQAERPPGPAPARYNGSGIRTSGWPPAALLGGRPPAKAREIRNHEQQVAELLVDVLLVPLRHRLLQLGQLLFDLSDNPLLVAPVETDFRNLLLDFLSPVQAGQVVADPVENRRFARLAAAAFSFSLIFAQRSVTSSAVPASASPKIWAWRRTIFSTICPAMSV